MTAPVSSSTAGGPTQDAKKLFHEAIGGSFYRQMLAALRTSTGKAAYFDGGQAEKIFQSQFDELIIERLSQSNGQLFSGGLFEQWNRNQQSTFSPGITGNKEAAAGVSTPGSDVGLAPEPVSVSVQI